MKEFSICLATAKKYISMTEEKISALSERTPYIKKSKTVLDDYINIIYKMLRDKIHPRIIISYIVKVGYSGNWETLRTIVERMAKNNFNIMLGMNWAYKFIYPDDVTAIQRNEILRYITTKNPKTKKSDVIEKNLDIMAANYPVISVLKEVYDEFHEILMGKEPDRLDNFVSKYLNSPVKQFVEGIVSDIVPVKNAISYNESNGFVEGNNNKFKLIKRILYGRANLDSLFKKCYFAFQTKKADFNLSNLLKKDATN
jgi:hypothetical protein